MPNRMKFGDSRLCSILFVNGNEPDRRSRRLMLGLGDGRIPSGILMASMTGVRLSFRTFGGNARSVHFTPLKHDPNPSSGAILARLNDGAGGRNRTDTPLGTAF
jgi:hypothetical protein